MEPTFIYLGELQAICHKPLGLSKAKRRRCCSPSRPGAAALTGPRWLGYDLIAADSPSSFLEFTTTADLIRQVLGAVSQFEKASLVGF